MKLRSDQWAGVLYVLPALAVLGAWVMLLVVHNPPAARPLEVLLFLLSEKPTLLWLRWFMILPLLYLVLCAAYLAGIARHRIGAIALFAVGAAAAAGCWIAFDPWLAGIATVPLVGSIQTLVTNPSAAETGSGAV